MGPLDAFWHLLNFFAPAVGVGLIAAALAKLLWRRELAGVALAAAGGVGVGRQRAGAGRRPGGLRPRRQDGDVRRDGRRLRAHAVVVGFGPLRR